MQQLRELKRQLRDKLSREERGDDERDDDSTDHLIEVDLPGYSGLREAVANYARRRAPGPPKVQEDGVAGLTTAINNVSDGMANGLIVGVNPVYGLYATLIGPLIGGIFSSSQLMVITTTAAASLTTSQALLTVSSDERGSALFIMAILIGIFLTAFGLLGMGRLIRFVSYSVTTGFLSGVAVLIILSQLPTVTAYDAEGEDRVSQAVDVFANLGEINLLAVFLALVTLGLAIFLPYTRVGNFGRLIAIAVPSILLFVVGTGEVEVVRDVGEIPSGLPIPSLPSLSLVTFDLVTGALSVSLIVLIQGAGVSQSVPNPDDTPSETSRDFIAQGAANAASGLIQGLPVGGSMSATALSVSSGARTRWAAIFAGLWMGLILVAFSGLVAAVAMPALGALLLLAGASSIKPANIRSVWVAGWPARIAGITTFLAMLFLPIQAAVGIGVALSTLLYVIRSSSEVTVVELVERSDGQFEERDPPETLPDDEVTVLDVYGNLFYAGARILERNLPDVHDTDRPVVVLRLRSQRSIGATLADVLETYAGQLAEVGGRLYLTGLSPRQIEQVGEDPSLQLIGPVQIYAATSVLGESTRVAHEHAEGWLVRQQNESEDDEGSEESDK